MSIPTKYLKTTDLRQVLRSLNKGEITFSRMVEILNEKMEERIINNQNTKMEESTEDEKKWIVINSIKEAVSNLDDLYEDIPEQTIIQQLHIMLEKRFDEESETWRDAF